MPKISIAMGIILYMGHVRVSRLTFNSIVVVNMEVIFDGSLVEEFIFF